MKKYELKSIIKEIIQEQFFFEERKKLLEEMKTDPECLKIKENINRYIKKLGKKEYYKKRLVEVKQFVKENFDSI